MQMISSILKLLASLASWFSNKQLIDAGKAIERSEAQEATLDAIKNIERNPDNIDDNILLDKNRK